MGNIIPAVAIPIIFISALSEPLDKVKTFDAGAVDYITKPLNLREWWLFWVDYSLTAKGLGRGAEVIAPNGLGAIVLAFAMEAAIVDRKDQ